MKGHGSDCTDEIIGLKRTLEVKQVLKLSLQETQAFDLVSVKETYDSALGVATLVPNLHLEPVILHSPQPVFDPG
jgi:hypothetical protein